MSTLSPIPISQEYANTYRMLLENFVQSTNQTTEWRRQFQSYIDLINPDRDIYDMDIKSGMFVERRELTDAQISDKSMEQPPMEGSGDSSLDIGDL